MGKHIYVKHCNHLNFTPTLSVKSRVSYNTGLQHQDPSQCNVGDAEEQQKESGLEPDPGIKCR